MQTLSPMSRRLWLKTRLRYRRSIRWPRPLRPRPNSTSQRRHLASMDLGCPKSAMSRRSMPVGGQHRLRPLWRKRDSPTLPISTRCGLLRPSRPRARPPAKPNHSSRSSICRRLKPRPCRAGSTDAASRKRAARSRNPEIRRRRRHGYTLSPSLICCSAVPR